MARDLTLALRLLGDASRLNGALRQAQSGIQRFGSAAKREFLALQRAASSLQAKLAGLGLGISAAVLIRDTAMLTRNLAQTQRTAKMTAAEIAALRAEFYKLGRRTAVSPEAQQQAVQSLVAAGLSKEEAKGALPALTVAMGTTKAEADILAKALTVAAEQFKFDLSQPKQAQQVLDQMAKAADLGSAELQNLSDIFARVGQRGVSAGFSFQQTLAFIEALSKQEKEPERLATLADSLLRLWTNTKYMEEAAAGAGVKFFTAKGARRDPIAVLTDFRNQYQKLKTDVARTNWIQEVVGKADLDTIKGFTMFMQTPGMIESFSQFQGQIKASSGFLEQGLDGALNNAIDQAERLKIVMREAAEGFAKPVENAFNRAVKWALDEQHLTGGEIAGGAAAGVAGAYVLSRVGKGILGRMGGAVAGVAAGKAVEAATGVTPVFVTNWPGGGITGAGPGAGAGAAGGAAAGAGMAKWVKGLGWVTLTLATAGIAGSTPQDERTLAREESNRRFIAQKTLIGAEPVGKYATAKVEDVLLEAAAKAVGILDQSTAASQQQLTATGDAAAAVIQTQGQAAQTSLNAAADRIEAAAANLAAAAARPQQVQVNVGVNNSALNAWADRRAELEGRRQ